MFSPHLSLEYRLYISLAINGIIAAAAVQVFGVFDICHFNIGPLQPTAGGHAVDIQFGRQHAFPFSGREAADYADIIAVAQLIAPYDAHIGFLKSRTPRRAGQDHPVVRARGYGVPGRVGRRLNVAAPAFTIAIAVQDLFVFKGTRHFHFIIGVNTAIFAAFQLKLPDLFPYMVGIIAIVYGFVIADIRVGSLVARRLIRIIIADFNA